MESLPGPQARELLDALSDGGFHSGAELARNLDITRAAVWKRVDSLRALGVPISAISGKGYRLSSPTELLRQDVIQRNLTSAVARSLLIEVALSLESTNTVLAGRAKENGEPQVLLAEMQSAGRGRWGRQWRSGFGSGLYLSLLWRFPVVPHGLSGLSLACAVAAVDALRDLGASSVGLKWPNDLLTEKGKLGGILIELTGEPAGPCAVVIGIGVNVSLTESDRKGIDQAVSDLQEVLGEKARDRNLIAAKLIDALADTCEAFPEQGFFPYLDRWEDYDFFLGKNVRLSLPTGDIDGVARGVDDAGALRLETAQGIQTYVSGDVRLRLRHDSVD